MSIIDSFSPNGKPLISVEDVYKRSDITKIDPIK